ncbi:MAG: AAA family ATPase [Candidatus Eisenbacteria bacterium]|uniref:non-specific protein-tyrosine kinase n=1 Tax=Eiseniibacteriota bacterium TaxID=2212470 RepID=A0A849SLG5_UNCEI|nr:AAA family ATPase [Candidatus Eisenbacteria bacterium]
MSTGPAVPNPPINPYATPSIDLRDIARMLWRRRWLLVVPWFAAALVGLTFALLLPPVYTSTVVLFFEKPQPLAGTLGGVSSGPTNADAQADVMREQLKSSLFLGSVITASGLRDDEGTRAWAKKGAREYAGLSESESIDRFMIDHAREHTSIRKAKGNVFQITVEDFDRDRARRLAESVANQFILTSKAAQLEAVRATQEFSLEQERSYRLRLDEAEGRLEAYRRNALTTSMASSSVGPTNLSRAQSLLAQTDYEAEDLRSRLRMLKARWSGQAQERDPDLLSNAQVVSLATQIVTLERQIATAQLSDAGQENVGALRLAIVRKHNELEVELGAGAGQALPNLSDDIRQALVSYRLAQADLAGVEARRVWLGTQVDTYQRGVIDTPDRQLEEQHLTQEVENARRLYDSFRQQSAIASIAEAFENAKLSGRFELIEPATRPLSPSKPNRPLLVMLGMVAGLLVGAATVLVVEQHDQSVRNADEIENLLGLPVLGAIPRVEELQRSRRRSRSATAAGLPAVRDHGLLHRLKVESPLGLEFRRTYLKLARVRGRQLPRSIVVTSSTRGEGKTTTSACLGITLARELRQKVLLVDFDLRSPALHRALGLPSSSWGLAQMLHHRHFDDRFIRATVLPDLEFLPAGKSERPASELVDTDSVEWFLKEATSRYAMVLIDSAPNLAVPDSLILGRAAEGVLYVIKAGSTIRKAAEYGVKVQREARDNVLGVLINDSGEVLPQYYGYRYNYYGYSEEAAGTEG